MSLDHSHCSANIKRGIEGSCSRDLRVQPQPSAGKMAVEASEQRASCR